jgi:hypothetical protein
MTASFGYGQQGPEDSSDEFNAITFLVRQMLSRLDVAKLVQVVGVLGGGVAPAGTVDVLPLVNQIDGAANSVSHGTVFGLPWSRTQGGKNAVICDPQVGDVGYVVCCDRDTSAVRATGKQANPGSLRQFDVADGVYAGGCLNVAPDQYLIFTATGVRLVDKNGNSVALDNSGITATDLTGNVISTSSTGITLTPKAGLPVTVAATLIVQQNLQLLGQLQGTAGGLYAGDLHVGGDVVAKFGTGSSVGLSTHRHTQGADGHGDSEQPTAAPTGGT